MRFVRIVLELLLVFGFAVAVWKAADRSLWFPGYFFHHSSETGWIRAQGTWVIDGDAGGLPQQTSTLECTKSEMKCREATTVIFDGRQVMPAALETSTVDKWTNEVIVFSNGSAACVDYVYTIDLRSEQVSGRRVAKDPLPSGCDAINENSLRLRLTDGGRR
jgi:hypothetical protein